MRKKTLKKGKAAIVFLSLAILFGCVIGGVCLQAPTVRAEATFSEILLPTYGTVGEEIAIPEVWVEVDGTEVKTTATVVYPDGSLHRVTKFTPTTTGNYTVEFVGEKDGKRYSKKKSVLVFVNTFTTSDSKSTIAYGQHPTYTHLDGLVTSLSDGAKLLYNQTIDFTEKTENDTLLSLALTPTEIGVADVGTMSVKFTDIYDPTNNVTLWVGKTSSDNVRYLRVKVNDGTENCGLERTSDTASATYTILTNYYNGKNYKVHKNSWGSYLSFSFTGSRIDSEKLYISMDYEEKRLFVRRNETEAWSLVSDLDDSRIYNDVFTGFKSGKAYVEIWAESYNTSRFNFVVDEIDGQDVLNTAEKVEPIKPTIDVAYPDGELPHAVVGGTYPIFDMQASVPTGNAASLDISVYYGYYSGSKVMLPIVDGRFETPFVGIYTVLAEATDKFGQTTEVLIDVECFDVEKLSATVVDDSEGEWITGERVTVSELLLSDSYDGAEISVKKKAVLAGEPSVEYEITESSFLPLVGGDYKIVYSCSNFTETVTAEYTVKVTDSKKPIMLQTPALPKYLIKNAQYAFPVLTGRIFDNGSDVTAQIVVKENGAGNGVVVAANEKYTVGDCESLEIIYTCVNGTESSVYTKTVPVVDVGYGEKLDLTKYFYKLDGDYAVTASKDRTTFFAAAGERLHTEFIRELIAHGLNVKLGNLSGGELNVYLTDRDNANERVRLTYKNMDAKTQFFVNGEYALTLTTYLKEKTIEFSYDNRTFELAPESADGYTVSSYENGKPFEGFSSGYVYLEFELTEGKTDSSFDLMHVWGQQINSSKYDLVRPYYEDTALKGKQSLGADYTLKTTRFSDVLDPSISVSVSVIAPDKTYVTATDGTVLKNLTSLDRDYIIKLTSYGQYFVEYVLEDGNGNMVESGGYAITVADSVSPTITLSDVPTEGKIGKGIKLATYTLSDDKSLAENITAFTVVKAPTGAFSKVDSGELTCTVAGVYTVYVYAMDEMNNATMVSYTIRVK